MQKAAVLVVKEYGGRLPDTGAALKKLPGIGEYTAAAIASIAFGEALPAVDGNLLRVFARMTAYERDIRLPSAKEDAAAYFRPLMVEDALASKARQVLCDLSDKAQTPVYLPGAVNQALMDLGATVCLPNAQPLCEKCPWNSFCEAHRRGKSQDYPLRTEKKPRTVENRTVLVIRYGERVVLRRRPNRGLLAGLYEFPNKTGELDEREAIRFAKELGFAPLRIKTLPSAKHIFTHKEWHMTGYEIRTDELTPFLPNDEKKQDASQGVFLASREELQTVYPVPSAFSAFLSVVL